MTIEGRTPEERERARIERERRRGGENGAAAGPAKRRSRDDAASPERLETTTQEPPPVRVVNRRSPEPPAAQPDPNRAPSTRRTARRRIAALTALAAALAALWFVNALFQPLAGGGEGEGGVLVTVPRGAEVAEIGELLAKAEIVGSARFFSWRAGWSGKSGNFQAGRYRMSRGTSYSTAIDALVRGPNAGAATITVAEGRSRYEIAAQTASQGVGGDYMAASEKSAELRPSIYGAPRSARNLEGFLFPATYELAEGATAETLVAQQLTAFKRNIRQVGMSYARAKNLTIYDIVTIASLIEREVQLPAERKLVAAVIYNRLKRGISLGIDATTRFETRNWTEPLTGTQLRRDTPYNTRTRRGLPPGPIGNPGLASLRAAARPSKVSYIYYVADPCKPGAHVFSSSDVEFQKDVERYQRARDAAGGKAPGGC